MNEIQTHLLAGYYMSYPATYFNKVLIVSALAQNPDQQVAEVRDNLIAGLRESGGQFVQQIKEVDKIAQHLGIGTPPLPRLPEEYFNWVEQTHRVFKEKSQGNMNNNLALQFAYQLGSLSADFSILILCLFLQKKTQGKIDKSEQIKALLKGARETVSSMGPGVMLLAVNSGKDAFQKLFVELENKMRNELPESLHGLNDSSMNTLQSFCEEAHARTNDIMRSAMQ